MFIYMFIKTYVYKGIKEIHMYYISKDCVAIMLVMT